MRVLFITREGYELSGARVRCYNFARELAKHGIDAAVFSFADHLGAKYGEHESEMSFFKKLWLNLRAIETFLKEPRETLFVLQRMNYHASAPLLVSFLKRNRVVFDCDDWNIRENPVYHFGFYPSSKMEYAVRKIAKRAVVCVAASVFLTDYLKKSNPRVHYLPTGVDTKLFCPSPRQDNARVTFSWTGTVYHPEMGENLRFLLSCFSAIADQYENVSLSLAGEGQYLEGIKKEIAGSKHEKKITVHPWISPDKVPGHLAQCDIGLLPLIQNTKFNCAKSPTKLFEYMSMAKPTISSDRGEASLVIRDGETGFLARDREEFISEMRMLIEDPGLRQRMGNRAREDVEKYYSLKVLGEKLAAILKDL